MKRLQGSRKMGWLILAVALIPVLVIVLTIDDWGRDWTNNTAATDDNAADVDLRPLRVDASASQLQAAVSAFVAAHASWDLHSQQEEPSGVRTMHLTNTTRIFRFVDDIHVRIEPTGEGGSGGSTLHAKSASRVGKGDLGQNPRNLKMLVRGVRAEL